MPLGAARITLLARTSVTAVAEVIRQKVGISAVGAQVDTAQSKFGGASAYFSTSEDALRITNGIDDLGSAWTFECWFRAETLQDNNYLLHNNGIVWIGGPSRSTSPNEIILMIPATEGGGAVYYANYSAVSGGWQTNQWYHVAVVHDNGDTEVFVDGTSLGSFATNSVMFSDTKNLEFGKHLSTAAQDFNGWMDEIRISNTARYTTAFTPDTAPFVNDDDTKLLLHMNGTDGSTFFEDDNGTGRSAVGVSASGDAQIQQGQSKFGGTSLYLDGASDWIDAYTDWTTTGDFTIEGWIRFDSVSAPSYDDQQIIDNRQAGGFTTGHFQLRLNNGVFYAQFSGASGYITGTTTASANTWYHWAVVRSGSNLKMYINGTQEGSTVTYTSELNANSTGFRIGAYDPGGNEVYGYIDEVRVSNIARYTVAFTPSTTPFVNDSDTIMLLHMDGDHTSTDFRDDNGVNSSVDPWNLDKTYFYASYDISGEDALPRALAFKPDGTKMYLCGSTGDDISQYSLGTAWDITTLSYDSVTVASGSTAPNDVVFNNDGTKMYVPGGSSDIDEFSLSTAWDLSTATNSSDPFNSSEFSDPQSCAFNNDGTKLFVSDGGSDTVYQYSLSTAYDISTGSYDSLSYDFSGQETAGRSVRFNNDGTRMYITGTTGDDINEYSLSSAFSLSSVTFVRTFSLANEDSNPFGIAWKPDGTKLYAVGDTRNAVFQYNVGYRSQVGVNAFDNAQIDTAESQFGGASAYFDGTNDYLLVDDSAEENFNFGTNDFTLEFWYKKNTTNVTEQIASNRGGYVTGNWYIQFDHTTDKIQWGVNGAAAQRSTSTFDDTSWHHLAITRNGGDFTLWIDGANEGELNGTTYVWGTSTDKYVKFGAVSTGYGNIWMDEVRISNTARYTSGFTPSTTQFQNDANTLLLLHCDGTDGSTTFVDDNGTIAG